MTSKRTRFDRRKKPQKLIMAAEALPPVDDVVPEAEITHTVSTAPWRLRRPWSRHLLYRLRVGDELAAKELDEQYDAFWADMEEEIRRGDNDKYP